MGGAASSPQYAKITVDVVNQESSEPGVSRVGLVIPVESGVFAAVEDQYVARKRKRADEEVASFVGSGERMHAVFTYFAANYTDGFKSVMGGIMADRDKFSHLAEPVSMRLILTPTGAAYDPEWDMYTVKPMGVALARAMRKKRPLTLPFSLVLSMEIGAHANAGIIKYNPGTREFFVLLFEPHATDSDLNRAVVSALTGMMRAIILHRREDATVRVVSPHSGVGLQDRDPLCAVWSILMLVTYLVNCEAVREKRCSFGRVQGVMDMLWRRRRHIIPAWLYTLRAHVPVGAQVHTPYRGRRAMHDVLDTAQCRGRARGSCTAPCDYDERAGVCYNTHLFHVV